MRNGLIQLYTLILFLAAPILVHAQGKVTRATQPPSGSGGAVIRDLATTWWLWAGIIVIFGLIGLLFYLRNKSDD